MNIFKILKENKQLKELQRLADNLERVNKYLSTLDTNHWEVIREVSQYFSENKKISSMSFERVMIGIIKEDKEFKEIFEQECFQKLYDIKVEMLETKKLKRSIEIDIGNLKSQLFGKFHF